MQMVLNFFLTLCIQVLTSSILKQLWFKILWYEIKIRKSFMYHRMCYGGYHSDLNEVGIAITVNISGQVKYKLFCSCSLELIVKWWNSGTSPCFFFKRMETFMFSCLPTWINLSLLVFSLRKDLLLEEAIPSYKSRPHCDGQQKIIIAELLFLNVHPYSLKLGKQNCINYFCL